MQKRFRELIIGQFLYSANLYSEQNLSHRYVPVVTDEQLFQSDWPSGKALGW